MEKLSEISVFFPAYNEEETIKDTVLKAVNVCSQVANKYEVIVVNDGSKDKTPDIVEQLAKENKNVSLISHYPNKGYGAALKAGMYAAKYENIAFTDSDGQFDFAQIEKFIPYINEYPVVIGYRKKRVEGFLRKMNAKALKLAAFVLFGLTFKDIDCAFKLFKKSALDTIPRLKSEGALISTEFLYKVKKAKLQIKELPVDHYPRAGGRPTGASLKVLTRAFFEIITLWIKLR
jgi:glycosyltransferase involved in cell wall biosynthesis